MAICITEEMRRLILSQRWHGDDGRDVIVEWQGEVLTVKVLKDPNRVLPENKRGIIKGFSDSSRFRALKYTAGIDWTRAGECQFVTLTYPDESDWTKYSSRQIHLSLFERDLRTHYQRRIAFLWRIEWKVRQSGACVGLIAPHVHLIILDCPLLTNANVNLWWQRSTGWRDYVNTYVEVITNREFVGYYVCKYAAKQLPILGIDAYLSNIIGGRSWGKRRPEMIPRVQTYIKRSKRTPEIEFVMRGARGSATCWSLGYNDSFTVLGGNAETWGKLLTVDNLDGGLPPE